MKILHCITTIDHGGAENQLLLLASEQVKYGNEITIFAIKGKNSLLRDFEKIGAKVLPAFEHRRGTRVLNWINRLKYCLGSENFDIIHCHLPHSQVLMNLVYTKIPKVLSFHNAERMIHVAWLNSFVSRISAAKFHAFIAISNTVKTYIQAQKMVPRKARFQTIYYGIPDKELEQENYSIAKPLDEAASFKILVVARLVKQKNLKLSLKAFAQVRELGVNAELIIAGEGKELFSLKKYAAKLSIENHVHFKGKVENMRDLYLSSNIVLMTSEYEGFGLVVLEAALYNRPIVVSDIPIFRELLGDDYPLLITNNEASNAAELMRQLSVDSDFCHETLHKLTEKVEQFKISRSFESHNLLYLSCIS